MPDYVFSNHTRTDTLTNFFFLHQMSSPPQDFCNHCHYSSACYTGCTLRGTTIILMAVILDLAP